MLRARPLIAVIDDDQVFVEMLELLLSLEGYQTIGCRTGAEAHALIHHEQPDVVLLDIRMEHSDSGWNALRIVQIDPTTRGIPVIVISADIRFLKQREQQLRGYGCAILTKPFGLDELLTQISEIIKAPRSRELEQ